MNCRIAFVSNSCSSAIPHILFSLIALHFSDTIPPRRTSFCNHGSRYLHIESIPVSFSTLTPDFYICGLSPKTTDWVPENHFPRKRSWRMSEKLLLPKHEASIIRWISRCFSFIGNLSGFIYFRVYNASGWFIFHFPPGRKFWEDARDEKIEFREK